MPTVDILYATKRLTLPRACSLALRILSLRFCIEVVHEEMDGLQNQQFQGALFA